MKQMPLMTVIDGGATKTAAGTVAVVGHSGGVTQTFSQPEPTVVSSVTAQLPILPEPLDLLHGPLLVTVDTWSDGSVVARVPALAIYAEGESDTLALVELGDEIAEFAKDVTTKIAAGEEIAGPLKHQWRALTAMVDASRLAK